MSDTTVTQCIFLLLFIQMVRSGAIAKRVVDELESLGCDTTTGCTGDVAEAAKAAFAGRTLADYYTEGMFTHDGITPEGP